METIRAEPGAVAYEWFVGDGQSVVILSERYADSAAVLTRSEAFHARFAARFLDLVEPRRFTVLGAPSEEAKAALTVPGRVFLEPIGGFVRGIGARPGNHRQWAVAHAGPRHLRDGAVRAGPVTR